MSKSKDKRIKKFNRKRIWPSILGLFLITLILFGIVLAILEVYIYDIINKKMYDAYKLSYKVGEFVAANDVDSLSEAEVNKYIDIVDNISYITVFDNDNDVVWTNTDYYPDVNFAYTYSIDTGLYREDFEIIPMDDSLFSIKDGYVGISDKLLEPKVYKGIIIDLFESEGLKNIPIITSEICIRHSIGDYRIIVSNTIEITNDNLIMVLVIFVLIVLLALVFMVYYICSIVSVARSQKRITKVLYTDMVTGGNNWIYFTRKGDKLLRKNRGRNNYVVINLRMDKYRSFCTCFGVKEGEELMEKFYKALKKQITRKELLAYHDEADFGLLISYIDEEDLLFRINKLEDTLKATVQNIKLYFKFGICVADTNDREIDSLYNNATSALELLDEDSEEKIVSYDIEMKKQQLWERKVLDEMDKALVTKQFKLYLQPKYSTKEEKLAGAEALVRWIHPVEGLIPPNKFIPIFENNGFILQLDDYMLEEVAVQQSKWLAEGRELFPISVNVSRAHFTREDLAEHISAIVDKYNVPHQYIELELTESAFFDDKYVLIDTVNQLRHNGFIVSMDDFGAGYSSLNSLKELTIDVLKIDADFFRGIDSVDKGMLIVSEVINLAKKLNMKIVAEGIERKEQVDFLTAQDCDLIQGYYFAKPMSIEEFEEKYN